MNYDLEEVAKSDKWTRSYSEEANKNKEFPCHGVLEHPWPAEYFVGTTPAEWVELCIWP